MEDLQNRIMTFRQALAWSMDQDWPELEVEGIDRLGVYVIHAEIEMENRMDDSNDSDN